MKGSIIKMFPLLGILLLASSCHKNETYRCYLIQETDTWIVEIDTQKTYNEGFIKKTERPYTKCHDDLDFYTDFYPDEVRYCDCGWEPD